MKARCIAALIALGPGVSAGTQGSAAAGAVVEVVGHNDLGSRGVNASIALGDHCAYVGSRGTGPVVVLDVSDPAHPTSIGELPAYPATSARELRTVQARHLLVVLNMSPGTSGGTNRLDFYHWDSDCAAPARVGSFDFGARPAHEFFLWQDPAHPQRILLFVAMFFSRNPDLVVVDASDPTAPRSIGSWAAPPELGQGPKLHSISVSDDGRRAYLSAWTAGLLVADSSDFASGASAPQLRLLTAPANAYRNPPGNVHSAVLVPGRDVVLTTDERYPPPGGAGCPFGSGHLVDVSDPAHPRLIAALRVPENDPARCATVPFNTWSTHNATLTSSLALISWYSAGFLVFDISVLDKPTGLAEIRPTGVVPRERDRALGLGATMMWSSPVVRDGLIYVVDQNQGMFVFRYLGPHQSEVEQLGFAEGNSNLRRPRVIVATPAGTPAASVTPSPGAVPGGAHSTSAAAEPAGAADSAWWRARWLVALASAAVVLAVATLGWRALRRRGD